MIFKNFRNAYKFILVVVVVSTSLISCGSDDDSIDPSLLVSNYQEPYLGFLINEEEFIAINGPAESSEYFGPEARLYYNQDLNGVEYYAYDFLTGADPVARYFVANVKVAVNQQNLAYLKGALTDIYGEPEFIDGNLTNSPHAYRFQGSSYFVSLIYSRNLDDPNAIIFVTYSSGG